MKIAALLALSAALLCAQKEIAGVVLELPYNTPVAGAEITFDQNKTVITGLDGAFRFQVSQYGSSVLTVRKEGYVQADPDFVHFSAKQTSVNLHMTRTGAVTGTVMDEDSGKPIAGLAVQVVLIDYQKGQRKPSSPHVITTDDDGRFASGDLYPGEVLCPSGLR